MERSSFLTPASVVAAAQVREGMRVADFGAGAGFFSRAAARAVGTSGVVWAVDAQKDLLPRIKNMSEEEGLTNVEVIAGHIDVVGGTHLPAHSFDLVIAANVLFAVADKHECVAEMRRILKPGGQVLLVDWSDSHGGLGPHPDHVLTEEDAKKLLEGQSFAVVRPIPAGTFHWGFLARKQ